MTLAAAGPHDNATLHRRKPSKELVGFRAEFLAAQLMRWKRLATGLITPGGGPHCIGHLGANVRFGSLADIDDPYRVMSALPPDADIRQRIEHFCLCQRRTSGEKAAELTMFSCPLSVTISTPSRHPTRVRFCRRTPSPPVPRRREGCGIDHASCPLSTAISAPVAASHTRAVLSSDVVTTRSLGREGSVAGARSYRPIDAAVLDEQASFSEAVYSGCASGGISDRVATRRTNWPAGLTRARCGMKAIRISASWASRP